MPLSYEEWLLAYQPALDRGLTGLAPDGSLGSTSRGSLTSLPSPPLLQSYGPLGREHHTGSGAVEEGHLEAILNDHQQR